MEDNKSTNVKKTVKSGITFGSALAMVISYTTWKSIGWAIFHRFQSGGTDINIQSLRRAYQRAVRFHAVQSDCIHNGRCTERIRKLRIQLVGRNDKRTYEHGKTQGYGIRNNQAPPHSYRAIQGKIHRHHDC